MPKYLKDVPCLVFSEGAPTIWKFSDGMELLSFLRQAPPFEYYVCDELGTYLVCCNDHDFIVGWGRMTEWIEQLKAG